MKYLGMIIHGIEIVLLMVLLLYNIASLTPQYADNVVCVFLREHIVVFVILVVCFMIADTLIRAKKWFDKMS